MRFPNSQSQRRQSYCKQDLCLSVCGSLTEFLSNFPSRPHVGKRRPNNSSRKSSRFSSCSIHRICGACGSTSGTEKRGKAGVKQQTQRKKRQMRNMQTISANKKKAKSGRVALSGMALGDVDSSEQQATDPLVARQSCPSSPDRLRHCIVVPAAKRRLPKPTSLYSYRCSTFRDVSRKHSYSTPP